MLDLEDPKVDVDIRVSDIEEVAPPLRVPSKRVLPVRTFVARLGLAVAVIGILMTLISQLGIDQPEPDSAELPLEFQIPHSRVTTTVTDILVDSAR